MTNLTRFCLLPLFGLVLNAEDPMATQLMKNLRETKTGILVLLDGPKGEWKGEGDRLVQDSAWVDLDISLRTYGTKAGEVEQALRDKYPEITRPGWALFGPQAKLLASGSQPPQRETIEKAAQDGGLRTDIQILKEFLRANPDQLEARAQLLQELKWRASHKTHLKLGLKTEPLRPSDKPFNQLEWAKEAEARALEEEREAKAAKVPKELTPEDDVLLWSEVSDQINRLMQSGDWERIENWAIEPGPYAKHSPTMKEVLRRALPEVESALRRSPTSWQRWSLWLGMSDALGGRPIRPLLDSLAPSPLLPSTQWPPQQVKARFVKDAKARQDWQSLKELMLPDWENRRLRDSQSKSKIVVVEDGKIQSSPWVMSEWRETLEPLVEALLRLGEGSLADQVVRHSWTQSPWEGLPEKARAVALRCNQASYAVSWGALSKGQ